MKDSGSYRAWWGSENIIPLKPLADERLYNLPQNVKDIIVHNSSYEHLQDPTEDNFGRVFKDYHSDIS